MCPTITVGFFRRVKSTFLLNLENRKHTKDPPFGVFHSDFFGTMRLFWFFWIAPKGLPFVCFDILRQNGCQKIPKSPPFYIFRHCDTVQKSHFKIFSEIFSNLPRVPSFTILSLRYSADVGRSRLVLSRNSFAEMHRVWNELEYRLDSLNFLFFFIFRSRISDIEKDTPER